MSILTQIAILKLMKNEDLKLQTLHCHTTNSDGALTPVELLDECRNNGIGVVAITDHDTLPTEEQVRRLKGLKEHPVRCVFGIELTSGYPKEIYNLDPKLFHIVGLFVDPLNEDIINYTSEYKELRTRRMKLKIAAFRKLGFKVDDGAVFSQIAEGGAPGTLSLVIALMNNRQNKPVIGRYFREFKELAAKDNKVKQMYGEIMDDVRGDRQKYFGMFFKDGSPFKIELPRHDPTPMGSVVSLIHNAGGVAFLAHWSFDRDNVSRSLVQKLVQEKRLDGVETIYDLFLLNNPHWKRKLQTDRAFLRKVAAKYGVPISGGVDAHKKEDLKLFADATSYSQETVGMVQKIIASTNCDVKNSSLTRDVDF